MTPYLEEVCVLCGECGEVAGYGGAGVLGHGVGKLGVVDRQTGHHHGGLNGGREKEGSEEGMGKGQENYIEYNDFSCLTCPTWIGPCVYQSLSIDVNLCVLCVSRTCASTCPSLLQVLNSVTATEGSDPSALGPAVRPTCVSYRQAHTGHTKHTGQASDTRTSLWPFTISYILYRIYIYIHSHIYKTLSFFLSLCVPPALLYLVRVVVDLVLCLGCPVRPEVHELTSAVGGG
jgi:hypothetical protein